MKKIVLLLSVVLLTSCVEKVKGTFEVKTPLSFKGKDGNITLAKGVHSAVLTVKQKKYASILVGYNRKVQFTLPKGVRLPTNSGELRLTAQEVGQPYDLTATAETVYSNSGPRTTIESCTSTVSRPVCSFDPVSQRRVCREQTINVRGHREVTFEYHGETTEFNFTLLTPASTEVVGSFNGSDYDSRRVVTNYGHCYLRLD
ncbi:MAG: hypothetical protein HYV97_07445 [Bdellovibrio sp.]|nr:hypothetical protein [Bdellovibrio sp.]